MINVGTKLSMASILVQNLRGFERTRLDLDENVLFLVGPNNSGKTSLLQLIDAVFNWPFEREFARASDELLEVLLPARETRNAARRLTIWVRVDDGRRHKAFQCRDGLAELRFTLRVGDRNFRANLGPPKRNESHDEKAAQLLWELRDETQFVHIPAGRSVDSERFASTLAEAMTASLVRVLKQPGRGATTRERDAQKVVASLEKLAGPVIDFWAEFLGRLPDGWVSGAPAQHGVDREILAGFIVQQMSLGVTTGSHDASGVPPARVGSGLQSLLDLELRRLAAESSDKRLILGIEEPEVFLHPSAQRRLGREFMAQDQGVQLLVSTHSPLVVEEASYEQVVIVRDHIAHQPTATEERRRHINTALTSGRGAEMFFSRSVLLVEGPGDREYWEALRRRVAAFDETGAADHCFVLETGSNTHFAPWLALLRSYAPAPIRWIALMDIDSAKEMRKCAAIAKIALSSRQTRHLQGIDDAWRDGDLSRAESEARRLSKLAAHESAMLLAPGDLEYTMCSQLSEPTVGSICDATGLLSRSGPVMASDLGTKIRRGQRPKEDSAKAPWIRREVGCLTPPMELDSFTRRVLERWISGAGTTANAREAFEAFRSRG